MVGLVLAAGCPGPGVDIPREDKQRVRVRSFSEAAPIRVLVGTSDYAFAAKTTGLERWGLLDGDVSEFNTNHGLPGPHVESMAFDAGRGWLWVATDGGLTRHDMSDGSFREVAPPPPELGVRSLTGAVLGPAGDGGLWIGLPAGLFYTTPDGQWTATPLTEPVTALHWARDGRLWIGTENMVVARQLDGVMRRYGPKRGCDIQTVRLIAPAPGGTPLIVGENADGEQRVALITGDACASYRAAPNVRWMAAAARGDELIILTPHRLYALAVQQGGARRLLRDGARLVPIPGEGGTPGKRSPYVLEALDARVPSGALVMSASNDEILIGTSELGIARISPGDRRPRGWLRRGELVDGATSLSVACVARDQCYIGTGSPRSWRYNGRGFLPTQHGDTAVLAFVRSPDDAVYALLRTDDDEGHILVSRVEDGKWTPVDGVLIEAPGRAALTFARFSRSGILWMGLQYLDDNDEQLPYGVAAVDLALGVVVYHHESADRGEVETGVLPIPIHVLDAAFNADDEIWLATSQGAVRVIGEEVRVFGENEGLASEYVRGIASTRRDLVYAATRRGVAQYDGKSWRQDRALRLVVNDLEMDAEGRLWMATDRGIALYAGARVQRLDTRRGLFENVIEELALDGYGRIWARSRHGVTLVTP